MQKLWEVCKMIKKNLRGNNEVLKILDECGLDEETCSKSKRLKQMLNETLQRSMR